MFSEIGNKSLLRRLAKALNVLDQKQVPSQLETDSVKVVAALDMAPQAWEDFQVYGYTAGIGVDHVTCRLISDATDDFSYFDPAIQLSSEYDYVIHNIYLSVYFDVAGAAAAAGKHIIFGMYRQSSTSGASVLTMGIFRDKTIVAADRLYKWSHPIWQYDTTFYGNGGGPIFVPAGTKLHFTIATNDASVFPANTQINVEAVGMKIPKGFRGPFL